MPTLTDEQLENAAEALDFGLDLYVHKETGHAFGVIPDEGFMDESMEDEHYEALQANPDDYIKVPPVYSGYYYQIMKSFAAQISDSPQFKAQLLGILDNHKPFRNFKDAIEGHPRYGNQWDVFCNEKRKQFVQDYLDSNLSEFDDEDGESISDM